MDSEASQHLLGDVIHPACLMVFSRSDTPVVTEIPPLAWDACQSELDAPRVAPCQATGQLSLLGWAIRKRQLMSATCIRKTRFLFGFSLQVRTDGEHHPQVPSETNKNKKAKLEYLLLRNTFNSIVDILHSVIHGSMSPVATHGDNMAAKI